jgi:hypothetical protein
LSEADLQTSQRATGQRQMVARTRPLDAVKGRDCANDRLSPHLPNRTRFMSKGWCRAVTIASHGKKRVSRQVLEPTPRALSTGLSTQTVDNPSWVGYARWQTQSATTSKAVNASKTSEPRGFTWQMTTNLQRASQIAQIVLTQSSAVMSHLEGAVHAHTVRDRETDENGLKLFEPGRPSCLPGKPTKFSSCRRALPRSVEERPSFL